MVSWWLADLAVGDLPAVWISFVSNWTWDVNAFEISFAVEASFVWSTVNRHLRAFVNICSNNSSSSNSSSFYYSSSELSLALKDLHSAQSITISRQVRLRFVFQVIKEQVSMSVGTMRDFIDWKQWPMKSDGNLNVTLLRNYCRKIPFRVKSILSFQWDSHLGKSL